MLYLKEILTHTKSSLLFMNLSVWALYVPDSSSEELSRKGTPPDRPEAPAATDDIPSIGKKHFDCFLFNIELLLCLSEFVLIFLFFWLPGETLSGPEEELLFLLTSEPWKIIFSLLWILLLLPSFNGFVPAGSVVLPLGPWLLCPILPERKILKIRCKFKNLKILFI